MTATKTTEVNLASLLRVLGTGSAGTVWLVAADDEGRRAEAESERSSAPLGPRASSSGCEASEATTLAPPSLGALLSCGDFSPLPLQPQPPQRRRRRALKMSPPTAWEASEQRILAQLDHPFVVPFLGATCDGFKNYLTIEASAAGDLYALLRAQDSLLSEGQARVLIASLACAVGYLHDVPELMYRDLKPENVVMDAGAMAVRWRRPMAPSGCRPCRVLALTPMAPSVSRARSHSDGRRRRLLATRRTQSASRASRDLPRSPVASHPLLCSPLSSFELLCSAAGLVRLP